MTPRDAALKIVDALHKATGFSTDADAVLWLEDWFQYGETAAGETRRTVIDNEPTLVEDLANVILENAYVRKLVTNAVGLEGSISSATPGTITTRTIRALEMTLSASGTRLCSGESELGLV